MPISKFNMFLKSVEAPANLIDTCKDIVNCLIKMNTASLGMMHKDTIHKLKLSSNSNNKLKKITFQEDHQNQNQNENNNSEIGVKEGNRLENLSHDNFDQTESLTDFTKDIRLPMITTTHQHYI